MTYDPRQLQTMFSIDVSADPRQQPQPELNMGELMVTLLRTLVEGQQREIKLLEEISNHLTAAQRQRQQELNAWREANPDLARNCRMATETLGKIQTQFLQNITEEVTFNEESLADSDFMLNEFVDRFGPRLAHLNGVLQVLSQLSSPASASAAAAP
jgi:hypothetical protein